MSILDDAKLALRITSTAYDSEVTDLIDACKADLALPGVDPAKIVDTDALVKRAIMTYVKANFGLDNPDAERLQGCYDRIKSQLSLVADYTRFAVTVQMSEQAVVVFDGATRESNDSGVVVFYVRAGDHYKYVIGGVEAYVDITADTTIDLR